MVVVKTALRWEARANFEDRVVLKKCGFRWDGKAWWTNSKDAVEHLSATIAVDVVEMTEQVQFDVPSSWEGHPSCATDGPKDIPCPPDLSYLPYQRGGIAYARGKSGVLIADEMGLGKTIQAIGILNDDPAKRVVILCPSSLVMNWKKELDRWLNYYLPICTIENGKSRWPQGGIVIMSYSILKAFRDRLVSFEWDVMIADEAHYLKNPDTLRTRIGLEIRAKRRVFLTGTPIENRPAEIWPIANALRPDLFDDWTKFSLRFCDARMGPYGWESKGSSNSEELQAILRNSIMIRRMKKDVLKDLPDKVRAKVVMPCNPTIRKKVDAELEQWKRGKRIVDALRAKHAPIEQVNEARNAASKAMRSLRLASTEAKLPMAIQFIEDAIPNGKVVVFAVHHMVLDVLIKHFGKQAVVITGETPPGKARQDAVDRFQTDPECTVFIGQIQAAGVGLTLTAASHVIFVEMDWKPGLLQQAEDRCHRIGQKDSVLCSYLVIENSLDDVLLASVEAKEKTIALTVNATS